MARILALHLKSKHNRIFEGTGGCYKSVWHFIFNSVYKKNVASEKKIYSSCTS